MNSDLLSIKQFATLCRTTPRTIRFYDLKNLLKPVKIDQFTKYRYYSPTQARDFFKIRLLQNFHVPLNQVKNVLDAATEKTFLSENLTTLKKEIEEKQKEYRFLEYIKMFLFDTISIKSYFKEETVGPYTLFCKYFEDARYDRINSDIFHLYEIAKTHKIPLTQKQIYFYTESIGEYRPGKTSLEIGIICKSNNSLRKEFQLPQEYYFKDFPSKKVQTLTYKGPFEYITLLYQKIVQLQHEAGFGTKGVFDMHLKGPWNTKSSYDFITKICFPLENQ